MKVFELAKEKGYGSKEFLAIIKEMGVVVRTPISTLPDDSVPLIREKVAPKEITAKDAVVVVPASDANNADSTLVDGIFSVTLPKRSFQTVTFEGLEPRFNQALLGIRRRMLHGKKLFSILTLALDPETLETKLVSEEVKRTDSEAILEFRMLVRKLKIEQ
jgi:hypothetical protein